MESIGIRELRQNASQYLRRVAAGESFTVTDHGAPVGELVPPQRGDAPTYDRLVARGQLIPPKEPDPDIWSTPPLPREEGQEPPSATLQAMREDERF